MKAKDLFENFGITRCVLRNYEEKGIIAPSRGSGGHRSYNAREVFSILEIKRQSDFGLSLNDLESMYLKRSLSSITEEYTSLLLKQQEITRKSIVQTNLLLQVLEQETEMISTLKHNLNRIWFERRPPVVYTEFSPLYSQPDSPFEITKQNDKWSEIAAFCQSEITWIDPETGDLSEPKRSFVFPAFFADSLELSAEMRKPGHNVMVKTVKCTGDDHTVVNELHQMVLEAKEMALTLSDDFTAGAVFCLHTMEEDGEFFYYKLYLPFKE